MKFADKLRAIARSLELDFAPDDDPDAFWLCAPGPTPDEDEVFTARVVADHWLYVAPFPRLFEQPVAEGQGQAALLHALLRENDRTKLGRFFIDNEGFVGFAADLRVADVSEALLDDTLNLIHHVTKERVPALAAAHGTLLYESGKKDD